MRILWMMLGVVVVGWVLVALWMAWEMRRAPWCDHQGRPISPLPDTVPDNLMSLPYDISVQLLRQENNE